jgi:hypothetical protein
MFTLIVTFLDTRAVKQYDNLSIDAAYQLIDKLKRQQRYIAWSIMDKDYHPVEEWEG